VLGTVTGTEGTSSSFRHEPIGVGDGLRLRASRGLRRAAIPGSRSPGAHHLHSRRRVTQAIPADEKVAAGWIVVRSSQASLLTEARASFAGVEKHAEAPRIRLDALVSGERRPRSPSPVLPAATASRSRVPCPSAWPKSVHSTPPAS
jgi:hypothetical protein